MSCYQPIDCVIAVTYNCNSRCTMCDIWKIKNSPEIAVAELKKLPTSLLDINVSGGEPFLRKDLPGIILALKETCPQARIIISSNGFATALILERMRKILEIIPKIGVAISIDGIGERHNEIRGIPNGFNKAITTVKELKKLGMKNLRLGFTVTERNVNQLAKVYDLSRELDIQFTHSYAQSSEFYFGGKQNKSLEKWDNVAEEGLTDGMALGQETDSLTLVSLKKQYHHLISSELKSWNPKKWARAYYSFLMFKFITDKNQPLDNAPGRDFFFLDPSGDIYPSVVHNFKMGNISSVFLNSLSQCCHSESSVAGGEESLSGRRTTNWTEIPRRCEPPRDDKTQIYKNFGDFWCSEEVESVRNKIDKAKMPVWMICTALTAIKRHPLKVGWWIVKKKLLSY